STRRRRPFVSLLRCIRRKRNCVCNACGRRSENTTFIAGQGPSSRNSVSCAWTRRTKTRRSLGRVRLPGDEEHVVVWHGQSNRSRAVDECGGTVAGFRASARL